MFPFTLNATVVDDLNLGSVNYNNVNFLMFISAFNNSPKRTQQNSNRWRNEYGDVANSL